MDAVGKFLGTFALAALSAMCSPSSRYDAVRAPLGCTVNCCPPISTRGRSSGRAPRAASLSASSSSNARSDSGDRVNTCSVSMPDMSTRGSVFVVIDGTPRACELGDDADRSGADLSAYRSTRAR
jgi:hypothetical protein